MKGIARLWQVRYLKWILPLTAMVLVISIVVVWWLCLSPNILAVGTSSKTHPESSLCGPKALFVAMSRMGIPVSLSELESRLGGTSSGVSFRKLREEAEKFGVKSYVKKLEWEELQSANTTAVLWVNGDHFVAVDPRESDLGGDGLPRIRVYDTETPGQWWSQKQLQKVWDGESLLLELPKQEPFSENASRISWEACVQDSGYVLSGEIKEFTFPLRNTGTADLVTKIATVGCGCANAELSKSVLKPGETAQLIVKIDTKGKRGFYITQVMLETNDQKMRYCPIYVRYGVQHANLVSADTLYFGQIKQGKRVFKPLYIYDAGSTKLEIHNIHVDIEGLSGDSTDIEVHTTLKRLEQNNVMAEHTNRLPLHLGDYVLELGLDVPGQRNIGPLRGTIVIETNQDGEGSRVEVGLRGQVISDIDASPRVLLLTSKDNATVKASVILTRKSSREIVVKKAYTRGSSAPILVSTDKERTDSGLRLDLVFKAPTARSQIACTGSLVFVLKNGDELTIPIVINTE